MIPELRALHKVWIDTDVALGAPSGDVDDGFALAALLAASQRGAVELVGISTVFGNATAERSEGCARELVRAAGTSCEIVRGAERPGLSSGAAERLARLSDGVEVLCLGPVTNVEAACRIDPSLPARARLRIVGGNLASRGFLPPVWPFEFNLARDRPGARSLLSRDWSESTLYPLDVVRRLQVDDARLSELESAAELSAHLASHSRRWLSRSLLRYGTRRFPVWDLPAALDAAGVLAGSFEERRLSRGARRLLATARSFRCLTAFDPAAAWRAFVDLVGGR